MTPEQIKQVEDMVKRTDTKDLGNLGRTLTRQRIDELHVLGAFGDRYGDIVKRYRMQAEGEDKPFSFEICAPHVGPHRPASRRW